MALKTSAPRKGGTNRMNGLEGTDSIPLRYGDDPYVWACWLYYEDGMTQGEIEQLWSRISCPTLLVYGKESWAQNPEKDGRMRHFQNARVVSVEGAGHWVHHDKLEVFLRLLRDFL